MFCQPNNGLFHLHWYLSWHHIDWSKLLIAAKCQLNPCNQFQTYYLLHLSWSNGLPLAMLVNHLSTYFLEPENGAALNKMAVTLKNTFCHIESHSCTFITSWLFNFRSIVVAQKKALCWKEDFFGLAVRLWVKLVDPRLKSVANYVCSTLQFINCAYFIVHIMVQWIKVMP